MLKVEGPIFLKAILLLSSYLLVIINSSKHSPSYSISHTPFRFLSHLFLSSSFLLFMSNCVIHLQVIGIKAGPGPNGEETAFIFVVSPLCFVHLFLFILCFPTYLLSRAIKITLHLFLTPRCPHYGSFFFLRKPWNHTDRSFLENKVFYAFF